MNRIAMARQTWRTAVGPLSKKMRVATWGLLIAAVVLSFVVMLVKKSMTAALVQLSYTLSVLAVLHWGSFISGAATLNRPDRAHLVPALNRQVRESAALVWVLTMLTFVPAVLIAQNGLLYLMAASVLVIALGLYRAGCGAFGWLAVASFLVCLFTPEYPYWSDQVLAVGCLLTLPFAAWALGAAFPAGGERHFAMLGPQATAQALDTTEGTLALLRAGGGRAPIYKLLLRRDLVSTDGRRFLWLHVLGRDAQGFNFVLPFIVVAGAMLALEPFLKLFTPQPDMVRMLIRFGLGVLMLSFYTWCRFLMGMRTTPREQALVRLAPAAPRADRINQVLGKHMLVACIAEWFAVSMLAVGLALLWNVGAPAMHVIAALSCAALSFTGASLGDYSRKKGVDLVGQVLQSLLCLVIAIVSMFWTQNPAVWWSLISLILAIALGVIGMRWRDMMAAPVAFPAGRFA